jgi:hypothetical protein
MDCAKRLPAMKAAAKMDNVRFIILFGCNPKHADSAEIVNRLDTFPFLAELSPSVKHFVIICGIYGMR